MLKSLDGELSEHWARTLQLSRNRISIHHAFSQIVSIAFLPLPLRPALDLAVFWLFFLC